MILTLERRGFIVLTQGQARRIRLSLPSEQLPPLQGAAATMSTLPTPHRIECQQLPDAEAALLHLGKIQIEHLLTYNARNPLDHSAFISLLNMVIESFVSARLSVSLVTELRSHASRLA